ncbi:hypothetical protein [Novacetimonas pomaceti]|uniref:hypothetical protein n=1 Tax=Novacetimonas pomaceti TaxID=2021998 RepID=UPI001C2D6BD7|nr:hypothetical protein [Novacetimonas pomaceti]MBV1835208.1 hypothetical protein [Novacetimonas pomaceti]
MNLFPKSFERRHLFEKRRHPKTFIILSADNTPQENSGKRFSQQDAAFWEKGGAQKLL